MCTYLRPSFLYPAASEYQLARGVIHLFNHGRLMMKFVREGCDMLSGLTVMRSTVSLQYGLDLTGRVSILHLQT